ncbi:maleylpyruvate isomerase family mycothiol-dependent enzyme [Arthrobacter sp. ISL-30]|uniref:maleylpyruvate isomerase family mycothiol-dependent enzyme n=1 Tax=Arthrobacter sp. ISL-30 TaxID=2819109 RepID=UPI001BE6856C|nr:maleylpyruvate isomerase family mycothiol-dependent enzyme [Arthrobacter sp. ISL-30]MBT2514751.1 maleylpyruvate isomerase family mycothiol-dependent enzyme [Arthrobacter sp. ISL-30]
MVARKDQATDPALLDQLLQARRGTAFFARKLNELRDAELDGDSLLPGWTRRHVVSHIGYNARAVARLVEWARTGVETPMYPSVAVRNWEIEFGATLSPIALRNLFDHSAVHLNVEWRDLPDEAWSHEVKTIQGRTVPASETVWMRNREIWVHAVDLNNGASFADIPRPVLSRLLGDITGAWKARGTDKDLVLQVTDAEPGVPSELGDVDSPDAVRVTGSLGAVTAWAAGRSNDGLVAEGPDASPVAVPAAPAWI